MEAHELRLGNLLCRFDGSIFAVTVEDIQWLTESRNPALHPKALWLSDRLFTHMGFKVEDDLQLETQICALDEKDDYIVTISGTVYKNTKNGYQFITGVSSFHDLQNLYYALTGDELKIPSPKWSIYP